MASGKTKWSLEELVDFEVAVQQSSGVDAGVGRRIRNELKESDLSDFRQRRWGLKEWLFSKQRGSGARVVSATRLAGFVILTITFLIGIGVIRGLVTEVDGEGALNIWVLLAGTIGIQWIILLACLLYTSPSPRDRG